MLVEVERVAVKPDLSVSELVARADALVVVMTALRAGAVEEVVCAGGDKVLVGTAMVMATEEAFSTLA